MQQESYKKYLSIGFIALFSIFLINSIVSRIILDYESAIWNVRTWWFVLSYIIQIAIVIYICFYPPCKTSIVSKIGGCLYIILELVYISNQISFSISDNSLIYSTGIFEYLTSLLLYTPGLLLFYWGCKLWLPVKILMTITIALDLICDMIWAQLIPMYQNFQEYSIEQTEPLQKAVDAIGSIPFFFVLVSLILTIVWYNKKSRVPIYQNQTIEAI